jgi:hypothetical protein
MKPSVCVDLDGVLAQRSGVVATIGDPYPDAQLFLRAIKVDFYIIIHTARAVDEGNLKDVRDWLQKFEMPYDSIWTQSGKPLAIAYVDNRAVVCKGDEGATEYLMAITRIKELI